MKLGLTESCHLDPECQRTYVRCVDPKCCWEVLWASVIFFTNNALYSSVTSDDTDKRASVASSGLRYHEHLALAQHFQCFVIECCQPTKMNVIDCSIRSRSAGEPWLNVDQDNRSVESLQCLEFNSCQLDHSLVFSMKQLSLPWIMAFDIQCALSMAPGFRITDPVPMSMPISNPAK